VSAFCCTSGASIVNGDAPKLPLPSITARPTPDEKHRFAELAARRGVSECAVALIAVRALLASNTPPPGCTAPPAIREPAVDRITIRAHVAANPPLAADELAALKQAVVVLAGFGRLLARLARDPTEAGATHRDLQQDLSRTRAIVAALEHRTHDLARAALVSWESSYD